jgi:hypothetical protein
MHRAMITFKTRIKSHGVRFLLVEYNPNMAGVEKIEIEGPNGFEIHATIHLPSVASVNEGREVAEKALWAALDRIIFHHDIAVENPLCTAEQYSPPLAVDAFADVGMRFGLVPGIAPAQLKAELEQPSPPGKDSYGLFRSARQSLSPVEEFMHLYHILLMLHNDDQAAVDAFIKSQVPTVQETPQPPILRSRKRRKNLVMETVYTKLRNELGHKRAGVNLEDTKLEMGCWLPGLIALTKQAIELYG